VSPSVPALETGCANVHRKLMVVDDEPMLVGSANLNNRSMVLDIECDIAIDANGDPRMRRALASMRNMLLAEHLGCEHERVVDVEVEAPNASRQTGEVSP
jgi:phospholipase D1/2